MLAFDRHRLNLALDLPVEFDLDRPDLAEIQLLPFQFPARPIRIGERIVTVASLVAWITWQFAILDTPKEPIIGFLEAQDHILEHMGSDLLIFWSHLFDIYQFTFLLVIANCMLPRQLLACLIIIVVG